MGSYTTAEAILDLLVTRSVGVHSVTLAQVEDFIAGIEGQVNGILLAQGYAIVPADGSTDVKTLGHQVSKKAATQVFEILKQPVDRSPDWIRTWNIDFGEWLESLRSGQARLVDQAPSVGQEGQVLITTMRVLPEVLND